MPTSAKGRGRKVIKRYPCRSRRSWPTLAAEASGRPADAPLLMQSDGLPWGYGRKGHRQRELLDRCRHARHDPDRVAYSLRHSAIVRMLRHNVPIRLVASLCVTSSTIIEHNYSAYIAHHADELARSALLIRRRCGNHDQADCLRGILARPPTSKLWRPAQGNCTSGRCSIWRLVGSRTALILRHGHLRPHQHLVTGQMKSALALYGTRKRVLLRRVLAIDEDPPQSYSWACVCRGTSMVTSAVGRASKVWPRCGEAPGSLRAHRRSRQALSGGAAAASRILSSRRCGRGPATSTIGFASAAKLLPLHRSQDRRASAAKVRARRRVSMAKIRT
jgi:hypothetical protein